MTSFLEYLMKDPDCLYIYNRDLSIYGLPSKERYTIIVKDNWVCPDEYWDDTERNFEIYSLAEWFDFVLNGKLIGWECACLNKKYVLKEHVKLLMTTNPIQLRKDVDDFARLVKLASNTDPTLYINLLRQIKFSIQIIQNHKIVNYKDGLDDYLAIKNAESKEEIWEIIDKYYDELKSLTDGMIKQQILKKANAQKI